MSRVTPLVAAINGAPGEASSWDPVDVKAILAGDHTEEIPVWLTRTDGVSLLYRDRIHSVNAEPESGKSWLTLAACVEALNAGETVLYVDYEDRDVNVLNRVQLLGADPVAMIERFQYVHPEEPATDVLLGRLVSLNAGLVVFDGLTAAFAIDGLKIGDNDEIAAWIRDYPRRFCNAGSAVVLIDHVVKDKESRGRYPIGGQHKLAGVDVAYSLHVVKPFGRGRNGTVRLKVEKDRPGSVRTHQDDRGTIAMIELISGEQGAVRLKIEPPEGGAAEEFRPTHYMERISLAIEQQDGLTKREIRELPGKSEFKDLALQLLVSEGFIEAKRDGQAIRHYLLKPYREGD